MQGLRRLAILLLPIAVAFVPFAATAETVPAEGSCQPMMGQMSAATLKYRATMRQLRAAERDLGPAGGRPPEAVMRTVRGYEALQREARTQRVSMLALYGDLEALGCPPFDRDGYEATRLEFERLGEAEQRVARQSQLHGLGSALR